MERVSTIIKHAWNAFTSQSVESRTRAYASGTSYGTRPDQNRVSFSNERSIIASIYTRLSVDVSGVDIRHVRLDEEDRYLEEIKSSLNELLSVGPNIDQAAREFLQDVANTMLENGYAAIVPVERTISSKSPGSFDILDMRVGEITGWQPHHVKILLYNDDKDKGIREEILLEKKLVAIVKNPFSSVMNDTNSTLKRIIRKLNLLDTVDEVSASGKLDLIVQLPYLVKHESKRSQAQQRVKDIEFQLKSNDHGIAYIDGTEKITQLNRSVENKLKEQVEFLFELLLSQLGLTAEIMNGTADEATMLNYNNRTIKPILDAIVQEMKKKFLTKTGRSQGQSIEYYRDPFELVPIGDMAELGDKFTRNEIMSTNEIRQGMGIKPRPEAKADELRNTNMPISDTGGAPAEEAEAEAVPDVDSMLSDFEAQIDELLGPEEGEEDES